MPTAPVSSRAVRSRLLLVLGRGVKVCPLSVMIAPDPTSVVLGKLVVASVVPRSVERGAPRVEEVASVVVVGPGPYQPRAKTPLELKSSRATQPWLG